MKRLIGTLAALCLGGLTAVAMAGDYHTGASLICSDCHVAHYSQSHDYVVGGTVFPPLGASGPYNNLLRNEENDLCLACHNGKSWAPDVFGENTGTARVRRAGGLNSAGHLANDAGYDDIDGHSLWSTATAPGGTFAATGEGLVCTNCHMQHGHVPTQYRNLWTSTTAGDKFLGKALTYATGTNDPAKDVFQRVSSQNRFADDQVDYNEPVTTASAYGNWCSACHTNFHGGGGATNMGGQSGGWTFASPVPWKRHPVADVNIGHQPGADFVSSLTQFNSHTNRVKVMDSQGLWDGTPADNTVTPSCMSCHKSHGNKNPFGMIFMAGTGTVTEEGDGGVYKDMCRQCHIQGG